MESMGFEEVVYLPLATDEEVFRPMELSSTEVRRCGANIGFVGNSMVGPVREWLVRVPSGLHPLIEELAQAQCRTRETVAQVLKTTGNEAKLDNLTQAQKLDFEGAVLWRATLLYRLECVRKLAGFRHRIHGDEGWTQLLGNGYQIHPRLGYYGDAPKFYNACRINLNATNLQMESAVNQRVFDVPACGAFILTDYQDSLMVSALENRDWVTLSDMIQYELCPMLEETQKSASDMADKLGAGAMLRVPAENHQSRSTI
jgi:spore maturation protein CgeB